MNALELMERLEGEILNNKVRVTVDGEIIIVAVLDDQEWVFTDEGKSLADLHSNLAVDEAAEPAAPKTRKKSAPAVESGDTTAETPAEEPAQAAA
jgi:hypothetical protein